jgi:diguanylate cyclase (GGDEF)-like protein
MIQKKLRILLAEGNPSETAETLRTLFPESAGGLALTVVSSLATLIPTVKVVDPEIILLDLTLSLRDPLDAVRIVHRSAPGIPLVVLADPAQKQYAAQSLSEGAMDYMLKGFIDSRTLDRVLRGALERNTFEGLADLLRDPITGLYTRDGLLTLGTRSQEEAQRTGRTLVLLCVLFENLHTLREGFGPGAAERALLEIAELLARSCRRSDLVARLGEAQFALLAVDADAPTGVLLRKRLERSLASQNETRSPWGPIDLRMSTGVWSGKDGRAFDDFLDSVEANLRLAPQEQELRSLARDGAASTR